MTNTTNTETEMMTAQVETKVLDVTDNSLTTQFKVALANRPDWAQSLTTKVIGGKVHVTYSDNNKFGVDLQAVWNYIDRHQ